VGGLPLMTVTGRISSGEIRRPTASRTVDASAAYCHLANATRRPYRFRRRERSAHPTRRHRPHGTARGDAKSASIRRIVVPYLSPGPWLAEYVM